MEAPLTINFANAVGSTGPDLLLEQDEWPERSASGFEDWIEEQGVTLTWKNQAVLFEMYRSNCDDEGCITARIRVYTGNNLNYKLVASYGTLSPFATVVRGERVAESIDVTMEDSHSVDFGEIISAVWDGDVYGENGGVVAPPEITIDGSNASWESQVVGALRVLISKDYDAYELRITPRDAIAAEQEAEGFDQSKLYASRVMAFFEGGFESLTVEPPDMNNAGCDYNARIVIPDPEDPEKFMVDLSAFDYCSGDDVANPEFWIDGNHVSSWPIELEEGEHTIVVRADGYKDSDDDVLTENDTFTL